MPRYPNEVEHSIKYCDDNYEYKHVTLSKEFAGKLPRKHRLIRPQEYELLGIYQTPGWVHYFSLEHERHVLMFKRKLKGKRNTR